MLELMRILALGSLSTTLSLPFQRLADCRFELGELMPQAMRDGCRRSFEHHVANVKQTVPPERLLLLDLKDGWPPLSKFLKKPMPSSSFPYRDSYVKPQARAHSKLFQAYDNMALRTTAGSTR